VDIAEAEQNNSTTRARKHQRLHWTANKRMHRTCFGNGVYGNSERITSVQTKLTVKKFITTLFGNAVSPGGLERCLNGFKPSLSWCRTTGHWRYSRAFHL